MKNKKADIPVMILVMGVFAICILAILSFNFSPKGNTSLFVGPYLLEDVSSIAEQINFYESEGINFEYLMNKSIADSGADLEIKKDLDGRYILKESFRNADGPVFSVEYKIPVG